MSTFSSIHKLFLLLGRRTRGLGEIFEEIFTVNDGKCFCPKSGIEVTEFKTMCLKPEKLYQMLMRIQWSKNDLIYDLSRSTFGTAACPNHVALGQEVHEWWW